MIRSNRFAVLLSLTLAAVAAPTMAFAQAPAAAAATPVTTVQARFQRYLLAPSGHVMGLMMQDGSVVHTRRLAPEAASLSAGDTLSIEGRAFKTPSGTFYGRAVVSKDGKVIADGRHQHRGQKGEHKAHDKGQRVQLSPMSANAKVAAVVAGPKGRVMALVLDDGTTAVGGNLETLGLKAGDRISVVGKGGTYQQGKALRIEKITLPDGTTRDLPKPEHHHKRQQQGDAPT